MELNLSPELQAKLAHIAAENNRGAEQYVRQLVEHYLDHDAWLRQKVKAGLRQLEQGEFVTHKEVGARIDEMFRTEMQVRWSPDASQDLFQIIEYIRKENAPAPPRIARIIS